MASYDQFYSRTPAFNNTMINAPRTTQGAVNDTIRSNQEAMERRNVKQAAMGLVQLQDPNRWTKGGKKRRKSRKHRKSRKSRKSRKTKKSRKSRK
jgi:hypothetical protein